MTVDQALDLVTVKKKGDPIQMAATTTPAKKKTATTAAPASTAKKTTTTKAKAAPAKEAEEKVTAKYSTKAAAAYISEKLGREVSQVALRRFLRTDDGGSNDQAYTRYGWNTEKELDELLERFKTSNIGTGTRGPSKKKAVDEDEAPEELSDLDEEEEEDGDEAPEDLSDDEEEVEEEEDEFEDDSDGDVEEESDDEFEEDEEE